MEEQLKKALKEKIEKLEQEFEGCKKEAILYTKAKKALTEKIEVSDIKLNQLANKGSEIAAKRAALMDILKE